MINFRKELSIITTNDPTEYLSFCFDNQEEHCQGKTALHHILPRAVFPQYTNLTVFKENGLHLSHENHYKAHALLYKLSSHKSIRGAWWAMNNIRVKNGKEIIGEELYGLLFRKRNLAISERQKGKTCVYDNEHNIIVIDNKDERFISGEFKSIYKGKIGAINKITLEKEYLDTKDYNKKEYFTHTTGYHRYYNNAGEIEHVRDDDARIKSGELISIFKGKIVVKDKEGNIFQTTKDDERFLTGELTGVRKGAKFSEEYKQAKKQYLNTSPKNCSNVKIMAIYDNNDVLKHLAWGDIQKICKENKYRLALMVRSVKTGERLYSDLHTKKYSSESVKKQVITRTLNSELYKRTNGWLCKYISKEEYEKLNNSIL